MAAGGATVATTALCLSPASAMHLVEELFEKHSSESLRAMSRKQVDEAGEEQEGVLALAYGEVRCGQLLNHTPNRFPWVADTPPHTPPHTPSVHAKLSTCVWRRC